MKKLWKVWTVALVFAVALTMTAAAASFDHCADALNQMGLFNGTENGYELDRAPTRAEAGAMLVRLLGKDAEAQAMTEYTAPFTDLAAWQEPYVQYLYENGLTTGVTATTFEPENLCDANMYSTFLLRALGYSDAEGDFTYFGAVTKATEIGLADSVNVDTANFKRDHVAAMSYTALATAPKDGGADSLLAQLVDAGAIDAASAKNALDTFDAYRSYAAASSAANDETKMAMDMSVKAVARVDGTTLLTVTMDTDAKFDMNEAAMDQSKLSMQGDVSIEIAETAFTEAESVETNMSYYYTDGKFYMLMDGAKVYMPMSFEDAIAQAGTDTTGAAMNIEPLSLIKSIQKSGDTYTIVYADQVMTEMVNEVLAGMEDMLMGMNMNMKVEKVNVQMTIPENSALSSVKMDFTLSMDVEGIDMEMDMSMDMKITGVGDSVVVTLPVDLDTYVPAA